MNLYFVSVSDFQGSGDVHIVQAHTVEEAKDAVLMADINIMWENIVDYGLLTFKNGLATIYDPRF